MRQLTSFLWFSSSLASGGSVQSEWECACCGDPQTAAGEWRACGPSLWSWCLYGGQLAQTVLQGPSRGSGRLSSPAGTDTSPPRYEKVVCYNTNLLPQFYHMWLFLFLFFSLTIMCLFVLNYPTSSRRSGLQCYNHHMIPKSTIWYSYPPSVVNM